MKTSIQIDPDQKEPHIVIHTSQITSEIEQLLSLLSASPLPLCVLQDERIVPVQPDDLYMVRVENGQTRLYTKQEIFTCKKRLYEIEELLGPSWIRISKNDAHQYPAYRLCRTILWHGFAAQAQKRRAGLCVAQISACF